ncbi:hypothetical protein OH77DRAFT_781741 [Trametes cingulata]|nr:hypothetical protein OH77DRAFT_781741 [Trametes cingulata]
MQPATTEVPFVICLAHHAVRHTQRDLLITIIIRSDGHRTTVDVGQCDEEENDRNTSPASLGTARLARSAVAGLRVFVPENALRSPIYIIVTYVRRHFLPQRLLITLTVSEWIPGEPETLDVRVKVKRLAPPDLVRMTVRYDE